MSRAADAPAARLRQHLLTRWFQPRPGLLVTLLRPLARLYGGLQRLSRLGRERRALRRPQPGVPVLVVGNLIVGGAGKTPSTIAIVQALRDAGWSPGVVSRGHGRQGSGVCAVGPGSSPDEVGDEPLLIHRRSAVPVMVARDRVAAALHLQALHPEVDVIVADDGLQHRQLRRDVEVIVFDERGLGNGLLLPAGPLREPFTPCPPAAALVLYNHVAPSTPWPGDCVQRRVGAARPLAAWLGPGGPTTPLQALRGRRLVAMAGIAVPERFFSALRAAGLDIDPLPMPDHHRYDDRPWPAGTREVVTTEKDAVKLARWATGEVPVWVVGLDFDLPAAFVATLLARLQAAACRRAPKGRP